MRMTQLLRILLLTAVLLICGAAVVYAAGDEVLMPAWLSQLLGTITLPGALVAVAYSPLAKILADKWADRLTARGSSSPISSQAEVLAALAQVMTTLSQVSAVLRDITLAIQRIQEASGETVETVARLQEAQAQTQRDLAVIMDRTR